MESTKISSQEITRLITYAVFTLIGAVALIYGIITGDWELIALGGGLLGTNTLAGAHVPAVVNMRK